MAEVVRPLGRVSEAKLVWRKRLDKVRTKLMWYNTTN